MKEMLFNLKGILLLTFVWVTLAAEESDTVIIHADCPRIDDINRPVMLPYGRDCSKYYRCSNGQAYLQQCPYNFHWSAATLQCDRPEVAQCQLAIAPITVTPTFPTGYPYNPNNPIPVTPTLPTMYPLRPNNPEITYQRHANDCSKYYQCQAVKCPSNLYWNSYTKKCDFPHLAQCPLTSSVAIMEPTPAVLPIGSTVSVIDNVATSPFVETSCPECIQLCEGANHQYLPYQPDCHKFIQCNGWPYLHTCPANLLWNDKLKTCDRFCIRSDSPFQ